MAVSAPASLPNYQADGLPKQDREMLRDARAYLDALLEDRDRSYEDAVFQAESTVLWTVIPKKSGSS